MDALGTLNFRDLGGIRVHGGTVRPGRIYRSEGPASFNSDHRAALAALGFRAVCDLRSAYEQQTAPNDWAHGARLLNFDIIADLRAQSDVSWAALRSNPTLEGARIMAANYRAMPAAFSRHLCGFVDALVAGETPMLVHCTAGKDRTGVLIALLLQLLGAKDEDIRHDLLSESFARKAGRGDLIRARFEQALGYPPDERTLHALIGVDPAYLDAMADMVTTQWGSVENYFAAAGIGAAKRAALVVALVEPA